MKRRVMALEVLAAAMALCVGTPALAQSAKDPGVFSGYFYLDYYTVLNHHTTSIDGMNGFWFRRAYLTYDKKLAEGFSGRFRLEASSAGDFTSSTTMQPFIKDLYVLYAKGDHKVMFGLIPTPTWESIESTLGYRHIEKSPVDLFKLGEARDSGISMRGPLTPDKKVNYVVMFGNGSGTRGETNKGKAIYGLLSFKVSPEAVAELYADHWDRSGDKWTTLQGNLMYATKAARAGLMFVRQERDMASTPDITLQVLSLFVDFAAGKDARPFFRIDTVDKPVPGADTISYLSLSSVAKPTLVIAGVDFTITDDLHLVPHIEHVSYRDPTSGPTPGNDLFFKFTAYFKF